MKRSLFGPRPGGKSRLYVIFVTRYTLRAVPDPPRLRVGTEVHVWIVGPPLRPGLLRRVDMAAGADGTLHRFSP
ncbi:MAG: hypothetical protein GDA36_06665 [Rhodobacteraceae bacterium]|nr:hypothetical protein [Paracoccaceae bacterium]